MFTNNYKQHNDLINAKSGDLIVRVYKSGRTAIGVYYFPGIIYLGLTFNDDGGMSQFERYGVGENYLYKYRNPTTNEIIEIKNLLSKSDNHNNIIYLDYISKYIIKIRKEKIKKYKIITNIFIYYIFQIFA
jgi:hypothetical protein